MIAAVTEAVETMRVRDVPEPDEPGEGEVIVRPAAVGICGSDFHFFEGRLSEHAGGSGFPRIQGHEVGGTIAAVGPGTSLQEGQTVALYPLTACGHCYPCRIGRPNVCVNFSLIGVHEDGGLQEQLRIPASQVFPVHVKSTVVAALVEPVSIAVRAVHRARIADGEHVVVFGAGPIGQSLLVAAQDKGASVMLVDPLEDRLATARDLGAQAVQWTSAAEVIAAAREWAGGAPEVVIDATGVPAAVATGVELVSSAGRMVQVGMSGDSIDLRIGSLTEKEIDVLGVACCGSGEFGEAVDLVERNADRLAQLVSHEFTLAEAPNALKFAMENPRDVMKVVIRGG
ncbi:MAG TPA: alcohol dehydrogenase catalytic domain-containing protein [Gaiellaceae bacterium]|nr:alcohol dehydrogenase catalytic domain-containing protein [Gaiellaceae bacterium]